MLAPYMAETRRKLELADDHVALAVFDVKLIAVTRS